MATPVSNNQLDAAGIANLVRQTLANNSGGTPAAFQPNFGGPTTGSSQAGGQAQDIINTGAIKRGDMAAEQAAQWNAVQDKGAAVQFEGKANSYAWMLLNKAVDNAIKALG